MYNCMTVSTPKMGAPILGPQMVRQILRSRSRFQGFRGDDGTDNGSKAKCVGLVCLQTCRYTDITYGVHIRVDNGTHVM